MTVIFSWQPTNTGTFTASNVTIVNSTLTTNSRVLYERETCTARKTITGRWGTPFRFKTKNKTRKSNEQFISSDLPALYDALQIVHCHMTCIVTFSYEHH